MTGELRAVSKLLKSSLGVVGSHQYSAQVVDKCTQKERNTIFKQNLKIRFDFSGHPGKLNKWMRKWC
jgi:hypothetical protein